jgi:hypothetical protein
MTKHQTIAAVLILAATGGAAWAGWSDIQSKAQDAKAKADDVHKYIAPEVRKIVGAMCAASDDNRKSAGQSEASNGRSTLNDKLNTLDHAVQASVDQLQPVANDYKDNNHSDASSLISDLKSRKDKAHDQSRDLLNGASVIDYIMRKSDSAKSDHRSRCSAHDLSLNGGSVPCIVQESDTCTVLEVAFDNSDSISHARDRARRDKDILESELKRQSPSSSVSKCKKVETRVDCYKVCPDVDDDGKYRESSASWRERCSS